MALDRVNRPTPPPQGNVSTVTLQRHASDIDFFLNNCVTKSTVTVANATNSTDVVTRFNELLAILRNTGGIGT